MNLRQLTLALTTLLMAFPAFATDSLRVEPLETIHGETVVVDGDTLFVDGRRLNLIGVAAPEIGVIGTVKAQNGVYVDEHDFRLPEKMSEEQKLTANLPHALYGFIYAEGATFDYGQYARRHLEALVANGPLECDVLSLEHGVRWAMCVREDKQIINYLMLVDGYAVYSGDVHSKPYPDHPQLSHRQYMGIGANRARINNWGLWSVETVLTEDMKARMRRIDLSQE